MTSPVPDTVMTVTGPVAPGTLGTTLMHEHLAIGFGGWQDDLRATSPTHADALAIATDRVNELQDAGVSSMVDPCPIDLGRRPELAAELSERTGFQIVMATGLYLDAMAGAHWKLTARSEGARYLADAFIAELEHGMGHTDIRAGIIKVATGPRRITGYERAVLEAAAIASNATGAPITTHTDQGKLGDEQQALLVELGVPAHRIVIGHSCGTTDHEYHTRIARGGSYLGFDRFGLESEMPDADRTTSLWRLIQDGFGDRIVVSQDTVWCWSGRPTPSVGDPVWHPLRFVREIAPELRALGATDEDLGALLVGNPRRYFEGTPLAPAPAVPGTGAGVPAT